MQRRYGFLILLSALLVTAAVYNAGALFFTARLPMNVQLVDGHTAAISPLPGTSLPAPLKAGDLIDLGALNTPARAAMDIHLNGRTLPLGHTYELVVHRNGGLFRVPVTTILPLPSAQWRWIEGTSVFVSLLLGVMSLLLLWYGRDRAAWGMAMPSHGVADICRTFRACWRLRSGRSRNTPAAPALFCMPQPTPGTPA